MPIWVRKFTFQKIKEFHEKQNEQVKKATKSNKPKFPQVAPSYNVKAPKK